MNIRKRTGEVVPFQEEKILNAMKKAFSGQAQELDDRVLDEMLSVVLKRLPENGGLTVERVQDEVERTLMEHGHYAVAKAYILYREKRAALRRVRADLAREVGDDGPWSANIPGQEYGYTGPTPEIAIGRCVVAYKLGEDIEIPDELLKDK
jgi:anaerobic ribonucleoside-triphosphate reductase